MVPLLALVVAAAAPPDAGASVLKALDEAEALGEAVEDALEAGVCRPILGGARPGAPNVRDVPWVTSCSVKPLRVEAADGGVAARLVWEVEGRGAKGERLVDRGEGNARLSPKGGTWSLDRLDPAWHQRVTRAGRRFAPVPGLDLPKGTELPLYGSGVAVRDFDGDGKLDIAVTTPRQVFLFHNDGGFKFSRRPIGPRASGGATYSMAVAGDFDGDGQPDLVLLAESRGRPRPSYVLHNDHGVFREAGTLPGAGIWHSGVATDFDRDGNLDLVILPYDTGSVPDSQLEATNGSPPLFLKGDGKLGFVRVPIPAPLQRGRWGLAAVSGDLLRAGRPQLYVANDFGSHDLWSFDGPLTESARAHGLTDPGNGMSADLGDVDGDGRLDLYVANMFSKAGTRVVHAARVDEAHKRVLEKFSHGNTLYLARADGGFEEVAGARGVNRGLWAFGSVFNDFDDDGRLDIAVANGFISRSKRKDY